MTASKEQIEKYSSTPHMKPSNREIQDVKNRTVRLDSAPQGPDADFSAQLP